MDFETRPDCFRAHLGAWAVLPRWMEEAVGLIKAGLWRPELAYGKSPEALIETERQLSRVLNEDQLPGRNVAVTVDYAALGEDERVVQPLAGGARAQAPGEAPAKPYVVAGKTAILDVLGPLQKGDSKFGGTSTLRLRGKLRAARDDGDVQAILLRIESPGGHVSGTKELADEVRAVDRRKPVYAYIEDLGASAAYWIASQARRISANTMAEVGSLGTFAVVVDSSKAFELEGLRVHVIATGEHKGAFVPGTEVTDGQLAVAQELVEGFNTYFLKAVQSGRRLTAGQLSKVTDGRTWLAEDARGLKLVDRVESLESSLAGIETDLEAQAAGGGRAPRAPRSELAAARRRRLQLEGDDLG